MIDVLIMGGTWAPLGHPVTNAFADTLDPNRFQARHIPYPADYGQQVTYAASVAAGRVALINAIEASPNPVILAGYSQGAGIAGDIARDWGYGTYPHLDIRGAALIADPSRPAGLNTTGPDPGGYGISGERRIDGMPVLWAAAVGDPITALPEGSALRTIADLSAYWTLKDPVVWARSVIDVASQNRAQRWWNIKNWASWTGVIREAYSYLQGGRHTDAYVTEGHSVRLAEAVNDTF
ncbi:PE-PPE domain-containing protein [Nocardia yunnanensis]|uniref:PE-PPE domain-containing protein n=1 Tax=Nocardia yunnanensis TaxID=2382165 RepID=A0A386ZKN1_9NOCA|nr:PE-PPE domain-containing protein [Nocardia yunnanensis]AYF77155.1 PE-PPE domain-containing protein [Nocardia yunnanensis]